MNDSSCKPNSSLPFDALPVFDGTIISEHEYVKTCIEWMQMQQEAVLSSIVQSLTGLSTVKFKVPIFDGRSVDPHSWMALYERGCRANGWNTDSLKITNLVGHFDPDTIAYKWYCSRLLEANDEVWSSWKSSFLNAFGENTVYLASRAHELTYEVGPLLEYYYEKVRLLQLAYGELSARALNTMVLMGLPEHMQDLLAMVDCTTKEGLQRALTRLMPSSSVADLPNFSSPIRTEVVGSFSSDTASSLPLVNLNVNDVGVRALLDTGASVDLIKASLVDFHGFALKETSLVLRGFNGEKKKILKSVSGRFRSGQLSGILGPSGAGKTCLLNSISGYNSDGVSGQLKTNGQPRDARKFRKNSCYITQEDLLVPLLSLHEVMCFAASLKLPATYTGKQKRAVVEEVQTMLGLSKCRPTRTEKLSGGQKKRLSVALELINNPPILFLDEPTSGLDNVSSINLLQLLRTLAHQGRTIVCTIHQPSASMFSLFDHVFVLAAGTCVYQGATSELVPFLSDLGVSCPTTHNPADFIIELTEDDNVIKRLTDATSNGKKTFFAKTPHTVDFDRNHRTSDIPLVDLKKDTDLNVAPMLFNYGRIHDEYSKDGGMCSDGTVSFWTQFYTLWTRMLLQISRNRVALQLQLWNHLGCSLMFGVMFYNMARDGSEFFNHMKFCIGVILFHTYTQCMIPILSYPFHVKMVKKEHFNQWYKLFPYYTALTCSTIPTITFFSMIFLTTVYALSGLPWSIERFGLFCVIGLFTAFIAEGMGLFIGAVFNVTNGTAVGPLTVAPFLGLAIYGFDFAKDVGFFTNILVHTSFMRCGVVALVLTVFGLNREMLECSDPVYCHFQDPQVTLHYLDLSGSTPYPSLLNMLAIHIVFRTALYLGLKWRLRTG